MAAPNHPHSLALLPGSTAPASRLLTRLSCAALWLLFTALQPSSAQDSVGVGGVNIIAVVDTDEIKSKWWFWLIIGLLATFFVVAGFFEWRGWSQWKKQKAAELAEEEEQWQAAGAKAGRRVAVQPMSARGAGQPGDLDLGIVGIQPPWPGEPLTEEQAEFLRERERRTATHQKRKWGCKPVPPAPDFQWRASPLTTADDF